MRKLVSWKVGEFDGQVWQVNGNGAGEELLHFKPIFNSKGEVIGHSEVSSLSYKNVTDFLIESGLSESTGGLYTKDNKRINAEKLEVEYSFISEPEYTTKNRLLLDYIEGIRGYTETKELLQDMEDGLMLEYIEEKEEENDRISLELLKSGELQDIEEELDELV